MKTSKKIIKITKEQREELEKIVKGQKSEIRLVERANIILLLSQGNNVKETARKLNVCLKTIRKWRDRFIMKGIKGLNDAERSGAPTKFTLSQRCEVIATACDHPSNYGYETHNHWTYDTLTQTVNAHVDGLNMSRSSVIRTLEKNDLKPHKFHLWMHSKDPEFKQKVNEIVSVYENDKKDEAVICVDEKTGMQALERINETKLPQSGQQGRYECDYTRHGTQALIAGFDIKTGEVTAVCGDSRTAEDLLGFMDLLADKYKDYKKIHIIWDNLNTHKNGPNKRWEEFNKKNNNKFEFHYTPTHASWVNQIEIFFSILQRRCLKLSSFKSKEELKNMIMKFIELWNDKEGHPFDWSFKGYPMQNREKETA